MENIQIKDKEGNLLVQFDGKIWEIFSSSYSDEPARVFHDQVIESPFYLFNQLEEFENSEEIVEELSKKSSEFREMTKSFQEEFCRLENRLVLFECYGEGFVDVFTDLLTVSNFQNDDIFIVETTVKTDFSDTDTERNALGEICVERFDGVSNSNALQLFNAINDVITASFDRWEYFDWSWDEIISNLKSRYPKLAEELVQIIEENKTEK